MNKQLSYKINVIHCFNYEMFFNTILKCDNFNLECISYLSRLGMLNVGILPLTHFVWPALICVHKYAVCALFLVHMSLNH